MPEESALGGIMAVLLITYDLNKENNYKGNYSNFYKIRDSYPHVKLSESSYAIKTLETPNAIFNKLKASIDKDDALFIIPLSKPYSGYGLCTTNAWLNSNM